MLIYAFKFKYMIPIWGKKRSRLTIWTLTVYKYKRRKKLVSKELQFSDDEKWVFNSINLPITKDQVNFGSNKLVI